MPMSAMDSTKAVSQYSRVDNQHVTGESKPPWRRDLPGVRQSRPVTVCV